MEDNTCTNSTLFSTNGNSIYFDKRLQLTFAIVRRVLWRNLQHAFASGKVITLVLRNQFFLLVNNQQLLLVELAWAVHESLLTTGN